MDDDDLPSEVWPVLVNRLWHATSVTAALAIIDAGEIRPDAASQYPRAWCRSLGGISLFDFAGDLARITQQYGNWNQWLGYKHEDKVSVWFEIDRAKVATMAPAEVFADWQAYAAALDPSDPVAYREALRKEPMPGCETCHIGSTPLDAVRAVLLTDAHRHALHEFVELGGDLRGSIVDFRDRMSASRPPPEPHTFATELEEARLGARLAAARARVDK